MKITITNQLNSILIFACLLVASCTKKDTTSSPSSKHLMTSHELANKFNLKPIEKSRLNTANHRSANLRAADNAATSTYTWEDVNRYYDFRTFIYFNNTQEADDFLTYVGEDPDKVIEYYYNNPDFFQRQLQRNGISSGTATSLEQEQNCGTCNILSPTQQMGWQNYGFCQNYMWVFNQICLEFQADQDEREVGAINSAVAGWKLGFDYTDLGGNGSFINVSQISFTITFQISLNLIISDVGTFYNYRPETHPGTYDVYTGQGAIYK